MATPLYYKLKDQGMTTYVLPGTTADIGQSYNNDRYKKRFSHFSLISLPRQNVTTTGKKIFDFPNQFESFTSLINPTFADELVNSLRNYIANRDETLRLSKISATEYYYDQNNLRTISERDFFKFLYKAGALELELAKGPSGITPNGQSLDWYKHPTDDTPDPYYGLLNHTINQTQINQGYYTEVLWKEREVIPFEILSYNTTGPANTLQIIVDVLNTDTWTMNLKQGDWIIFSGTPIGIPTAEMSFMGDNTNTGLHEVLEVQSITSGVFTGKVGIRISTVTFIGSFNASNLNYTDDFIKLNYNRVVNYIGEISAMGTLSQGNQTINQIIAMIPEEHGRTPSVLFRTIEDTNYRPGLAFPMLPEQYSKYVIQGAESPNHPFNTNPENEVGNKYGLYDFHSTSRWQYTIQSGDSTRRTGDFFGTFTNSNQAPTFDAVNLDGICIDWNKLHYSKMNDPNAPIIETFNQFNSSVIDGLPPQAFEFNAILWFYEMKDTLTNLSSINLYAISFLDNPNNDCGTSNNLIPLTSKIAPGGNSNPTSFNFLLGQGFAIEGDTIPVYDPEASYVLRDFNIFSEAVSKLNETNETFLSLIKTSEDLSTEVNVLKNLVYTQTDINVIKNDIQKLNNLLTLYQTLQIGNSESIIAETDITVSPAVVRLKDISSTLSNIIELKTSTMYDKTFSRIIPTIVQVPTGKDFMLIIENDDINPLDLSSNLKIILDKKMDLYQTLELILLGTNATEDKLLDIEIKELTGTITNSGWVQNTDSIINTINLPVNLNAVDSAFKNYPYRDGTLNINEEIKEILEINIVISPELELRVKLNGKSSLNLIKEGDRFKLDNFRFIINNTTEDIICVLDGHRQIKNVVYNTNDTILYFDMENNLEFSNLIQAYQNGSYIPLLGPIDVRLDDPLGNYFLEGKPEINSVSNIIYKITCIDNVNSKFLIKKEKQTNVFNR